MTTQQLPSPSNQPSTVYNPLMFQNYQQPSYAPPSSYIHYPQLQHYASGYQQQTHSQQIHSDFHLDLPVNSSRSGCDFLQRLPTEFQSLDFFYNQAPFTQVQFAQVKHLPI